ncbi:MAG: porin [Phycisphaerales bacterium]
MFQRSKTDHGRSSRGFRGAMAAGWRRVTVAAATIAPVVAVAIAVGAAAAPASAVSANADVAGGGETLDLTQLRQEIERARTEGDQLRREFRDLRDAGWEQRSSDRRSAEISALVAGVVADVDARTSLLSAGYVAGWDGGFFLQDPEGRFRLNLGVLAQTRYILNHVERGLSDRVRDGFEISRAELSLSGHIFTPDLDFMVRTDPTRNQRFFGNGSSAANLPTGLFYLKDFWVRYRFAENWRVRFGQFKLPFNREELVEPGRGLAVERSLLNEGLNIGRSQGIEIQWEGETERARFSMNDGPTDDLASSNRVGLVDEEPRINSNALRQDFEYAFAGRYEMLLAGDWNQFHDFTSPMTDDFGMLFGIAGHVSETDSDGNPSGGRNEVRWYGAAADLSVEFGGANIFGSFIYQYVDSPGSQFEFYGAMIQGGWYLTPEHEFFGRWEWGQTEGVQQADLNMFFAGWNWYVDGHDAKFTMDFGFAESIIDFVWASDLAGVRQDQRGDEHQWVFRSQFQLMF